MTEPLSKSQIIQDEAYLHFASKYPSNHHREIWEDTYKELSYDPDTLDTTDKCIDEVCDDILYQIRSEDERWDTMRIDCERDNRTLYGSLFNKVKKLINAQLGKASRMGNSPKKSQKDNDFVSE